MPLHKIPAGVWDALSPVFKFASLSKLSYQCTLCTPLTGVVRLKEARCITTLVLRSLHDDFDVVGTGVVNILDADCNSSGRDKS